MREYLFVACQQEVRAWRLILEYPGLGLDSDLFRGQGKGNLEASSRVV